MRPAGWAVVTGQLSRRVTLDFDGEDGVRSYEALRLPSPHRRTPRGGYHIDFVWPGFKVTTFTSKSKGKSAEALRARWPGIDIRGDGGYAVFRGMTADGKYQWISSSLEPYPWDEALWNRIFPSEQPPRAARSLEQRPHRR